MTTTKFSHKNYLQKQNEVNTCIFVHYRRRTLDGFPPPKHNSKSCLTLSLTLARAFYPISSPIRGRFFDLHRWVQKRRAIFSFSKKTPFRHYRLKTGQFCVKAEGFSS